MNQKRIIRFDYGYTKTAEPADQCSREPEFTELFQRAAQITAHKKEQASSDAAQKCVQGAFDLDSLYEAAKELGYFAENNPFKNPQRFADNFDAFARHVTGSVNSKGEEYALALFQKELMLSKHISQVEAFLNDRSFSPDHLTAEQWNSFDEAIFWSAHDVHMRENSYGSTITPTVKSIFESFIRRYTQQQEDFFHRLPFEKLATPDMLARVLQRAEKIKMNFERFLIEHLENPKFEKLIAAYLRFFPDRVSAGFLSSVLEHIRQIPERTFELQEVILGKPGEELPALFSKVLARTRNETNFEKVRQARDDYTKLIINGCLIGHPDSLRAFEKLLQDKNDFAYQPDPPHKEHFYKHATKRMADFLGGLARKELASSVRKDLQAEFQHFSERTLVLFPTLYRQANAPAVLCLAALIERSQNYHRDRNPKSAMDIFEAAYQKEQLANDKEYHPPSYDSFSELLRNDSFENSNDREALYETMLLLMQHDEMENMFTQLGKAINAGSQASPEVVEIYMKRLKYRSDDGSEDAKIALIKNHMADFLEKELNPAQYIRWAKALNEKPLPEGGIVTFLDFTNHMGKIETFLTAEKAQERKPYGYTQLYVAYAQMLEQYGQTAGLDEAAYQPSATLAKLDRAGLYTSQQQLAPLALLKKHSLATQEKYAKHFFDSLKLNLDWFHDDEFNTSYPQLAQLPTRQEEYRAAMKEIAESVNHNTVDAVKALLQKVKKPDGNIKVFTKMCQELKLQALKKLALDEDQTKSLIIPEKLKELAIFGNPAAIPTLFELWNYDKLLHKIQDKLKELLTHHKDENAYPEVQNIRANILAQAESALKHHGRHEAALELITYAAQQNVEGSFEVLERIALQESADSDAALKKLFTRHEGETPQELEQVRQRFLDDWRNRLESDNVDEQELQKLRDLAGDDNTIIMNELSGSLNDYDQRQVEKAKAEAEKKAAEEAAENMRTSAGTVVAMAPTAPPKQKEPELNLTELYEIIVDENQSELERAQALSALASQISTEADALPMLSALLWDVPDETFVDQILEKFLVFSNQPAVAQELALLIEDCEQGRKDSERCEYILSYLSQL